MTLSVALNGTQQFDASVESGFTAADPWILVPTGKETNESLHMTRDTSAELGQVIAPLTSSGCFCLGHSATGSWPTRCEAAQGYCCNPEGADSGNWCYVGGDCGAEKGDAGGRPWDLCTPPSGEFE